LPSCAGAIALLASPGAPADSLAISFSSADPFTMRAKSSVRTSGLIASNCFEIAISALRNDGVFKMPINR
jgi:hypothetical protein